MFYVFIPLLWIICNPVMITCFSIRLYWIQSIFEQLYMIQYCSGDIFIPWNFNLLHINHHLVHYKHYVYYKQKQCFNYNRVSPRKLIPKRIYKTAKPQPNGLFPGNYSQKLHLLSFLYVFYLYFVYNTYLHSKYPNV